MFAAMTRFNLVLVIMANFAETAANAPGFLVLLAAGALLSAATNLIFGGVVRAFRQRDQGKTAATPPVATASQRFARWKRSLRNLSGWQYTLRLALCLGVATLLRLLWPSHHLYWVALTVVLLAEREIERLPVKTTQRALGTTIGVIGAGLIIAERPSAWVIAIGFGLLAGLRPLLRVKNYLAYSAVMTPLVILMMDAGHAIDMGVAMDRLFATLVGAFLVIATNRMFWILLGKTPGVRAPISNRPNR
jgi:uncharacterized membrane protein YccC